MANNNVEDILKAADCVIRTPSVTVIEACSNFGVSISPATGFVIGTIIAPSPIISGILWIYNKIVENRKKAEEKERMLKEIICKQQTIIKKLKENIGLNKQEIKNLKEMLEMLQDVATRMKTT